MSGTGVHRGSWMSRSSGWGETQSASFHFLGESWSLLASVSDRYGGVRVCKRVIS
jgi:hypothetical protein